MSTTAPDVDSHERAPPSEQGVVDLAQYTLQQVRRDAELVLFRGLRKVREEGSRPSILVRVPVTDPPASATVRSLQEEYALRTELDAAYVVRPLSMVRAHGLPMLILEDPLGTPLDLLLNGAMDIAQFLRLAISVAAALGHVHSRGLIHKDVKPANILVNAALTQAWLMGLGVASRLPRERQSGQLSEFLVGTLAYMAPEQTGRMNRSIDSRSDLYSLGVSFYQMLTGSLPFTASDPMEWVHCHIARKPIPPAERSKNIPVAISQIVMALLAKTAEERYQTAVGVESDLRRCLVEWECQERIDLFTLREHDARDRLLIPEKIYGRAREVDALIECFDRVVTSGQPELVLVRGYSGVGKSSVVNELHRALVASRGLFASGKFDQYKRDIPYSTLVQALRSLVRPLLGKSDAELNSWRDDFMKALDPNGRLMVDLVPELKLIIGEQVPLPDLPPHQAQARFQLVFRRFISVFARPERPLALFLDDLHWLDSATLDLLEDLLTRSEAAPSDLRHLILIGAYRDNEVDAAHPLTRKLQAIRNAGTKIEEITLVPLGREPLKQLIADALRCEPPRAAPLAQLVHEKTGGNPFFAVQFISSLAEEGLLRFEPDAAGWSWDLERIRAKGYTDNVVDLMVGKLTRLRPETQKAMQQLACIGNTAAITTLSIAFGTSEEQVHADLSEAVRLELVERLKGSYRFVHDRVQEAAYSLIPKDARAPVHLHIGRLLATHTPPEEREETIFEIVSQLNRGAVLITEQEERERVAELNLIAGKRAKASTAYVSACAYLGSGMTLLGSEGWTGRYELALDLCLERAECEYLGGNFDAAEPLISELLARAASKIDRAAAYRLKIDLHVMKSESPKAVESALECLRLFGIEMSPHPAREQVEVEYEKIWSSLGKRSIESLIDLPLMTDPEMKAAMQVLSVLFAPALTTDISLTYLHVCHMVNVTLKYGTTGASTPAYAFFGIILRTGFNRYADSYRFGRLACDLVEKHNLLAYKAKTYISMEMIALWTQPLQAAIDYNETAFRAAVETGDLHVAGYSRSHTVTDLLLRGDHLDDVWQESERGLDFARRAKFHDVVDAIVSQQRFIENMRGRTAHFSTFSGAAFDEDRFEAQLTEDRTATTVSRYWMYWIIKIQARFLSGDYATALVAARKAKALIWVAYSHIRLFDYYYYTALAITAAYRTLPPDEQVEWREILAEHLNQLREWAESCPATFRDKHALVAAETARLDGRELDAERLYEEAIRSARTNGFVQNEALAYELAARFYATRGFDEFARLYLRHARERYLRWGALGKVRQLEEWHPHLGEHAPAPGLTSTIGAQVEHLDLATVIKVSQALSSEMVLEKLIDTLMRTAIEHAGAVRGLLILAIGDEQRIAAEATTSGETVIVHVLDDRVSPVVLPESVLQCVVRTQESVILDDASAQNLFSADPYFHGHRARSVHCLPLSNRGTLVGVLYLENNLASRVFAPARTAVLKLLASQAAISLENSRLYRDLAKREAKIRRLVDANIVGIFIWDVDGTILEANDAFLRMMGYEREDLVSGRMRWPDMSAAQWLGRDRQDLTAEIQRTGSLQPFEWDHIRKDGGRMPVLIGAASFEGQNQGVSFVLDLTERKRAEQALRQGEAYLAESQRLTHTGSWAFDPSAGKVVYWSDEMFRIYGRDRRRESLPTYDELLRYVHPEDRDGFNKSTEKGRDKAEMTVDFRIVMADGMVKHLHSTRLPVLDKIGAPVEIVGTLVDVTERRRAEQRLLVQYRVTRILAEAATVEEATPKILQAICECLGWDRGSLWRIDREAGVLRHAELWHAPSFVAPQFDAATRMSTFRLGSGILGRVWASRAPIYTPDIAQDPEVLHRDAAAREGLHVAFAFPILLGSEVLGVMGFLSRDVLRPDQNLLDMMATLGSQIGQFTKRIAAVDELQLRVSMLQNIPVAAWSVMPDGTPDIVNQLWYEYTGQTPEYVNSHPEAWMATLHPEDRDRASRSYWDGIHSGRGFTMEARFLRARDGTYRWHLNRAVPVRDAEGNLLRLVGTSTDVHDWRQAQEALRNTQTEFAHMTRVMTMGELTASIAHEVNQPLGAIVTSAAAGARWLATKPPQMDKARRALERIANDGKRAAEVIRRIRALMKRQAPRKEWLDINETILEVIALAQYQLRRNAILLETRLGHHLPLVRGDRVQLQQVLLNLIINAIEAMSGIKERPRELTIVSSSDGPDTVSVEVRDSGTGLDPEHAPHLFEPFYTTKAEGLGIGLSISLSIVEAHGGRLSATANAPHGTVFLFSLPVDETAP
jgi:PAS domain S-box-containing protein